MHSGISSVEEKGNVCLPFLSISPRVHVLLLMCSTNPLNFLTSELKELFKILVIRKLCCPFWKSQLWIFYSREQNSSFSLNENPLAPIHSVFKNLRAGTCNFMCCFLAHWENPKTRLAFWAHPCLFSSERAMPAASLPSPAALRPSSRM